MKVPSTTLSPRYVIVSPVKDEESYIELTLRSVISQSIKPIQWVIVNDGSKDKTNEIINTYADRYSFISVIQNPHSGIRQTGSAVIRAFNYGLMLLEGAEYDFIVKLDCDLSFEPDYFEKLLERFKQDERLGIASGIYMEQNLDGYWRRVAMPTYHAAGACKVIRRKCFREICGFVVSPGWDTVDEIRAMSRGWTTGHFVDLRMKHHKPEGTGIGLVKTNIMHGEIYYLTGGGKLFLILKVFHRLCIKPLIIGALALVWGYLSASFKRKVLLVNKSEARCYQMLLNQRVIKKAKSIIAIG